MRTAVDCSRRRLLTLAVAAGTTAVIARAVRAKEDDEVSPVEDLMREHGVLRRVLLVYAEAGRRIEANAEPPAAPLADAAQIVRTFVEDYHERNEETHLFPRFRAKGRLVELVDVLQRQHQAGRALTDAIIGLAAADALRVAGNRQRLADTLRQFSRMYAPHAAREDTVLFPALRAVVSEREYDDMGERFEEQEHRLFGEHGFERMVDRIAEVEKAYGIYDLAQFTPPARTGGSRF